MNYRWSRGNTRTMRAGLWDLTQKWRHWKATHPMERKEDLAERRGLVTSTLGAAVIRSAMRNKRSVSRRGGEPNPKPSRSVATGSSNMTR